MTNKNQLSAITGFHSAFLKVKTSDVGNMDAGMMMKTEKMMQDDPVIRVVAKVLIPAIMLFALYVQFHGDYGPGGGFQAGVIFAAAFVLNAVVFGLHQARQVWPLRYNLIGVSAGVLLYGGTGVWSILAGGNYLDYFALEADPKAAQHLGILLVEFGVGLTVAAVMVVLFFAFAGRASHIELVAKTTALEATTSKPASKSGSKSSAKTRGGA